MTPAQAYRAALEAAAKVAEDSLSIHIHIMDKSILYAARQAADDIAAAIRALPVPQADGDMVMVPREPTEEMIGAVAQALHKVEWANVRPPLSYLNDMDGGEWWERAARAAIHAMINAKE